MFLKELGTEKSCKIKPKFTFKNLIDISILESKVMDTNQRG